MPSFTKYTDQDFKINFNHDDLEQIYNGISLDALKKNVEDSDELRRANLTFLQALYPEIEKEVGKNNKNNKVICLYLRASDKKFVVTVSKTFIPTGDLLVCVVNGRIDGRWCLQKLASSALALSKPADVSLRFLAQEDEGLTLQSSAVHPLQVLENGVYQRFARKALTRYFVEDKGSPLFFEKPPSGASNKSQLVSVKMDNLNETYFLARLLVRYEAESSRAIPKNVSFDLSGNLTKLLHNGDPDKMAWLSEWLTKKISQIRERIGNLNKPERRILFYLKGGRALNYFLGTPQNGENDWDTQIVIDPSLPAETWYKTFFRVHDVILEALQEFRSEFTTLVESKADLFAEHLNAKGGPSRDEDEEVDENEWNDVNIRGARAGAKAELIDVGIRRRDSPAGVEEWTRLSKDHALITAKDGIIYPHKEYYLNEYLMLIRGVFLKDPPTADLKKSPKRISRFGSILSKDPGTVDAGPLAAALPKTLAQINQLSGHRGLQVPSARQDLFRVMFLQFVEAYNLLQDSELAAQFDNRASALIAKPPALPPILADELKQSAERDTAIDVGVAHTLSELMNDHWKSRNTFFEGRDQVFMQLLREMSDTAMPTLAKAEAQFAVAGSFAARLQARHLRVKRDRLPLEPIRRILVKLQCREGKSEVATLDAVRKVLTDIAEGEKLTVRRAKDKYESMLIYWGHAEQIGQFKYAPLVMKIRGAAQTGDQLPVLSSIEGVPVLDLRYLVADYRKTTARIDESGSRGVLLSAIEAVSELLSRFDFDSDEVA